VAAERAVGGDDGEELDRDVGDHADEGDEALRARSRAGPEGPVDDEDHPDREDALEVGDAAENEDRDDDDGKEIIHPRVRHGGGRSPRTAARHATAPALGPT
jgi:hypothetical protein